MAGAFLGRRCLMCGAPGAACVDHGLSEAGPGVVIYPVTDRDPGGSAVALKRETQTHPSGISYQVNVADTGADAQGKAQEPPAPAEPTSEPSKATSTAKSK